MKKGISRQQNGFTIVELLTVVIVIGILATILVLAYGGWRQKTADNVMQSDLNGAASAMEDAKTWGSGYPTSVPSTFHASSGVAITGGSTNGTTYCLQASSATDLNTTYYITNSLSKPAEGTCPS